MREKRIGELKFYRDVLLFAKEVSVYQRIIEFINREYLARGKVYAPNGHPKRLVRTKK